MRGPFINRGLSPRIRFLPRYSPKLALEAAGVSAKPAEGSALALPQFAGLSVGLICAAILGLGLAWRLALPPPAACDPAPLVFHIGRDIDTDLALRAGAQCPVYVLPGQAALDQPVVTQAPLHGSIALRGHTGVTYRPDPGFHGDDIFAVALNGRTPDRAGAMTIRVRVAVK